MISQVNCYELCFAAQDQQAIRQDRRGQALGFGGRSQQAQLAIPHAVDGHQVKITCAAIDHSKE
jgi:hypothetical protein